MRRRRSAAKLFGPLAVAGGVLVIAALGTSGVAGARLSRPVARLTPPVLSGRFAFGVDAPVDFHSSIAPVESQYLLRKSLNRYRITGSGQLAVSGGEIVANSSGTGSITDGAYRASGTVAFIDQRKIGGDIEVTLLVVGADSISTAPSTALHNAGVVETHVHLQVRVVMSNSASCPVGRTGSIFLTQDHYRGGGNSSVVVVLCDLSDSFTNDLWNFPADKNSVRVVLAGGAFGSQPRSQPPPTGKQPDLIAIKVNGETSGVSISTGALTCSGAGFGEGTSCYVYAQPGSSTQAEATIDRTLPSGWTWSIDWEPYGGSKTFNCTSTQTDCVADITVPDLGGTVAVRIATPNGGAAAAMYVVACKHGETPYPGHPCPY